MIITTVLLLAGIAACEKETTDLSPRPTVRVPIASSGLGDMSYNDNILRAVLQVKQEHDFRLEYVSPRNTTEAEKILRSWQHEVFIAECYDGFRDGYLYAGGKEGIETYLSTTQKGFAMPQRAYIMADSLYKLYPFIYAMAGNSNNEGYQYLRDYPEGKYTAGVDVDQSAYSSQIIDPMIKETGRCLQQYITSWMQGEDVPMREWYTLELGFMLFKVAEPYKSQLEQTVIKHLPITIKKECDYEKVNATTRRVVNVRL